jgi:hypothetical protein
MIPHSPLFDSITGDAAPAGSSAPALGFAPTPVEANTPSATPAVQANPSIVKEPYYKNLVNADGTLYHKALDNLPDHLAALKPTLARQKTIDDVFTVMSNQLGLIGRKALGPLPPNATPDMVSDRKVLLDSINGVPKDPKDYGITKPETLANELWNESLAKGAAEIAHKYSASPQMLKDLVALQTTEIQKQFLAQQEYERGFFQKQQDALTQTLKLENIPMTKAQELAERGAQKLGLDLQDPDKQRLMKNSDVFLMAMRHALATSEDKFVSGESQGGLGGDPSALAKDATSNKSNPLYAPYWDAQHPQNKMAKETVNQWRKLAAAKLIK